MNFIFWKLKLPVDSAFGYIYKGELDNNVSFVQSPFNLTPIAII